MLAWTRVVEEGDVVHITSLRSNCETKNKGLQVREDTIKGSTYTDLKGRFVVLFYTQCITCTSTQVQIQSTLHHG